jgi:hypothetical protein
MLSLPYVPTMLGPSSLQRTCTCATNAVGVIAVVAKVMAKVTTNVNILASRFCSLVFDTVTASAVAVIGFVVLALLFAIFVANVNSFSITMLILSIFLKIMQIDSVGL